MRPLVLAGALLLVLALQAQGGLVLLHTSSAGGFEPIEVEVPFGRIVSGSTRGANETNASVSIAGSLLQTTTDILYINNTNTTGLHHARLELVSYSGIGSLDLLKLGIDNGTATVDQIVFNLGSITDDDGTYVRLEPGSTNTIYVTQNLDLLLTTPTVTFWVYSADDASESAYVKTRAQLTIT